jgi:hypothetical protein
MNTTRLTSQSLVACMCLTLTTLIRAASDDEIRGEQQYNAFGVAETEKSFWDGTFWRNLTNPLAPANEAAGPNEWLYFGTKSATELPYAEAIHDFTLHTGARLGFTPPVVQPVFARVWFGGDRMVMNGTPDVPGAPLGRFRVGTPHPLGIYSTSLIDFDRTIVETTNLQIHSLAGIIVTGDVTTAGETFNLRNTGGTSIDGSGAGPNPNVRLRSGAIAQFSPFNCGFGPPAAGTASVVKIESGSQFTASSSSLYNSSGTVFDATHGWLSLGGLYCSGSQDSVLDPLVVFKGAGTVGMTVSGGTDLDNFSGTLADITDGATLILRGPITLIHSGNKLGLRTSNAGGITLYNIRTGNGFVPGSTQADWEASSNGFINVQEVMGVPLHLDGTSHSFRALSGGSIILPTSLGMDTTADVSLTASGAGSLLRLLSTTSLSPNNYFNVPTAVWDQFNLQVTNGGTLRGGDLTDFGGGYFYSEMRTLYVNAASGSSVITVANGTVERVALTLSKTNTFVQFGTPGAPATLRHVDLNLGDSSLLSVRGGTWQPEQIENVNDMQTLQIGDSAGGSFAVVNDSAIIHSMSFRVGNGVFIGPGDPLPVVNNSTLTVAGGSTVTGTLAGALFPYGRGQITFSGAGTTGGFRNVQLGVTAFPNIQNGPFGPPGFDGTFFFSGGGDADLNLTTGARVSVGSFTGAFATWNRPDLFLPAYFAMNGSDINIDADSALFIGDAVNSVAVAYQTGALVVGSGGYLVGIGNINGAALPGAADLVVAGGTVSPGFSPGTLHVDGGFSMSSGTLVLEVRSNSANGWDVIEASSINITGGTIIIKPTDDFDAGLGFVADFFNTASLTIGPGVTIQIDPIFTGLPFNPTTGAFVVVSSNDANNNGIDDRLEAVLPPGPSAQPEWPVVVRAAPPPIHGAPPPVPNFTFRRQDSSVATYALTVQWSTDLKTWTDIAIPQTSAGDIVILPNGNDPDTITVTLPPGIGAPQFFVKLKVTTL